MFILMKAQLQNHSLSSHEPCPLFPLGLVHFTIMLSSYSHRLSLECTQRFSILCLIYGPFLMNLAPCFIWALIHFTIILSFNSRGLSLECTQRFLTLCLKYGPKMYSSPLGSSFFISLSSFFEVPFQLEYIVAFPSKSMNFSSFWPYAYNKEA